MYKNYTFFVLSLTSVCIFVVKSMDYNNLENMGITCQNRVSCDAIENSNFTNRNCECDLKCAIYNDCCIDALARPPPSRRRNFPMCMPYGDRPNIGVYAINTCSPIFTGPEEIRRKCQNSNNISDPLMAAPVTDTISRRTYWNSYCAECNNIALENLQTWWVGIDCDFSGIESNNVIQNLTYRQDLNKWGINLNQEFHGCDIIFDKPQQLVSSVRLCRANIISNCPSHYAGRSRRRICESYTAVMYTRGETVYKNPHCALCHGLSIDDLDCTPGSFSNKKKPGFYLRDLFNININNEINKPTCTSDQIYDPFLNTCRNKVCALPDFTKLDGKCVPSS